MRCVVTAECYFFFVCEGSTVRGLQTHQRYPRFHPKMSEFGKLLAKFRPLRLFKWDRGRLEPNDPPHRPYTNLHSFSLVSSDGCDTEMQRGFLEQAVLPFGSKLSSTTVVTSTFKAETRTVVDRSLYYADDTIAAGVHSQSIYVDIYDKTNGGTRVQQQHFERLVV